MGRELARGRRLDALAAAAGLALLLACGFVVRNGTVGPAERAVFGSINGLPESLEPLMRRVQLLGVLAVGPVAALVALILGRVRLAVAAVVVTLGKLVAERLVWEVVQRQRPGVSAPDAIVRGGTPTTGVSFVSGHVVLVTALARIATSYIRGPWRAAPWAVVALVAFARIYLGAHNPLDVVGGLGLGVALGALANLLVGVPSANGQRDRPSDRPSDRRA